MNKLPIFVTFSEGRTGWKQAGTRIIREANDTNLFSQSLKLDGRWLFENDPDIFHIVRNFRNRGLYRGYGYWVWKTSVLTWAHKNFPNRPILYMDSGSHISREKKMVETFKAILLSHSENGLAWQLTDYIDKNWCKKEVIDYLKSPEKLLESGQVQSGFILLPPGEQRKQITFEFRQSALHKAGLLFSDEITKIQDENFIEHRHDQAIFSQLWKKYDFGLLTDRTSPQNFGNFPITAIRNNTGVSAERGKIKRNIYRNGGYLIDKILKRQ